MSDKLKQEAANEVRVLSRLRHPFIINYRECFVEDGLLCVVTDFAESGDLYRSIEKQRAKQDLFSEELVLRWFTQIALALKHIHDRHILHRDLKTQNIFLAGPGEGIVKVGDFGIARVLQHTQDLAKTAIGTPFYLSPEICQEKPYSYQSDIWSLGCILYELATLRHAFDADSMQGLVVKILRGIPSEVASTFSVEFRHMIPKMLQKDPHHRPSVDAILKMTLVRRTIRHLLADLESQQGLSAAPPHPKVFSEARRRHPLPLSETNTRLDSPKTRAAASASPSGRQHLHDAAHDGKNSAGRAPSCPSRTDHKMRDSFDTVQRHLSLQGKMHREGRAILPSSPGVLAQVRSRHAWNAYNALARGWIQLTVAHFADTSPDPKLDPLASRTLANRIPKQTQHSNAFTGGTGTLDVTAARIPGIFAAYPRSLLPIAYPDFSSLYLDRVHGRSGDVIQHPAELLSWEMPCRLQSSIQDLSKKQKFHEQAVHQIALCCDDSLPWTPMGVGCDHNGSQARHTPQAAKHRCTGGAILPTTTSTALPTGSTRDNTLTETLLYPSQTFSEYHQLKAITPGAT
ncbi:Serine/threonine-protein kinase Nek1 [Symbiodinium microadriaticum]|uniref:non-specific serine/threonine protein kinase n=1 Tax=Symbiodinium microadriaticum TaxID=2951 RepID=A0A1Q9DG44_SYMMI|nr:Serine/threonine-protein kinase Nek1 [Symbiodinium microadriaticum]